MSHLYFRYVAIGESFASLAFQFRVGKSSVQRIIKDTSDAVWEVLQPLYMPVPDHQKWEEIARHFFEKCNVPNCIGSVDGKHCRMKCPPNAGPLFHNYKQYHSIVLMAIADSKCCFTLIDVGAYGRNSDSAVFSNSNIGKSFFSGQLNIPQPTEIAGTNIKTPFYLIGDEAFPLKPNLMRPYPRKDLDYPRKVYNCRISRARRTVECAFGMLTQKFGVLKTSMETSVEVSQAVVKSICVLHNFVHYDDNLTLYSNTNDAIDDNHENIRSMSPTRSTRPTVEALSIRDALKHYFVSPGGAVEWQDRSIH